MKVLVIGANGMAGHVITKFLKLQGHSVTTMARSIADIVVDIENIAEVQKTFEAIPAFDFVINCIGLLVKDSNDRPDRAALINGWFPHYLEQIFANSNTRVVHLSTDCVFDGKKGDYVETDTHTETNPYGKSKALGEINNAKDITFRMSIIGPEIKATGTGLFQWIASNPQQELQGWDNAWWNGITTLELAKCINRYMQDPKITGVYHLVSNENKINKFDLLCKINEVYAFNKTIIRTQGPKPVNKILIDTRNEFNFNIVDYDTMINEMKNFN